MIAKHWNIIPFPTRKTPSDNQVDHTIVWIENRVQKIEETPSLLVIYWERDTRNYMHAKKFFEILRSHRYINISANSDSDITYDSIITVMDDTRWEYQLPVDYFIRMTTKAPWEIKNDTQSILEHLSNLDIQVEMNICNISTKKTTLTKEKLSKYKPEEILWFTNIDSVYECEMYHTFGLPTWHGEIEMFDLLNHDITLLDLMIISMENTELGGYKIEWANMEVISIDGDNKVITTITAELLEDVVHSSLKRINPLLYGNMVFRNAHQYYFQKVVVPKIRPEDEDTDWDE